jgi:hypothetical protein
MVEPIHLIIYSDGVTSVGFVTVVARIVFVTGIVPKVCMKRHLIKLVRHLILASLRNDC